MNLSSTGIACGAAGAGIAAVTGATVGRYLGFQTSYSKALVVASFCGCHFYHFL